MAAPTKSPRRVKMFRAYRDPHIPPRARNAFMMGSGPDQQPGEAFATPIGVHVKTKVQSGPREYLVPWANVECVEYFSGETEE